MGFAGEDDAADSIFNFIGGECAIGGLEAAGNDAGLVVSGDLFAAVKATKGGVMEEWSGAVADGVVELFPGDVFGEYEVEVAVDSGEAGDGSEAAGGLEELFEDGESEFGYADAVVEFAGIEDISGEFSDPAEWLAIDVEFCAAAGEEFGPIGGAAGDDGRGGDCGGEGFDDTEYRGEGASGDEGDGEGFGLMFGLSGTCSEVDAGDFEEFGVGCAVAFVLAAALEEAGDEALAELVFVAAAGVGDGDRGDVTFGLEEFSLLFADEGEGEGFEESAGCEVRTDEIEDSFAGGAGGSDDREWCVCGDMVVAVHTGDFFDEVNFACEVEPPARWLEGGGFGGLPEALETELLEDGEASFCSDFNSEQMLDSLEAKSDGFAVWWEL